MTAEVPVLDVEDLRVWFRTPRGVLWAVNGVSFRLEQGHPRILVREVLPNVLLPVLPFAAIMVAAAIVAEGSLSFLGLVVPPPHRAGAG